MDKSEFRRLRKILHKNQKQMAQLLGVSLKAVHSYEQGWRVVPPAVERQLYFLASRAIPSDPCPRAGTSGAAPRSAGPNARPRSFTAATCAGSSTEPSATDRPKSWE